MIEIEQKYRISNPPLIRQRLLQLGARRIKSGRERNELFDLDGNLRKRKSLLRLRLWGKRDAWLTFKGPRLRGQFKRRLELETMVDYNRAKLILQYLDFKVVARYEKRREAFKLSSCIVALDYLLPKHGWFLEVEGSSRNIRQVAKRLGLQKVEEERSYPELLKIK